VRTRLILGGFLVWTAAVAWFARDYGRSECEAAHSRDALKMAQAGEKLENDRRALAIERSELMDEIRRQADADPVVVERCIGPGRVQRLNAIR